MIFLPRIQNWQRIIFARIPNLISQKDEPKNLVPRLFDEVAIDFVANPGEFVSVVATANCVPNRVDQRGVNAPAEHASSCTGRDRDSGTSFQSRSPFGQGPPFPARYTVPRPRACLFQLQPDVSRRSVADCRRLVGVRRAREEQMERRRVGIWFAIKPWEHPITKAFRTDRCRSCRCGRLLGNPMPSRAVPTMAS